MNDLLPFPKAAGAIQVSNNLSVLSRKFFNVMLAVALPQLGTRREFAISISSLKLALRLETNNYDHIEAAMLALMTQPVQWSIIEPDTGNPAILTTTLMAQSIRDDDVFRFSFADGLAERLLDPELFGMINVNLVASITNKMALALYENATVYENWSPWVELPKFCDLLGVRESIAWNDLQDRYLKPAVEEVRKHTGVLIEYEALRKGRGGKVTAIRLRRHIDDAPQTGQLELLTDDVDASLIEMLTTEFELTRREAFNIAVGYDGDRVREVLDGMREQMRNGVRIAKKAGWIYKALKNVWVFGKGNKFRDPNEPHVEADAVLIDRFKKLPWGVQEGMIDNFVNHPDNLDFKGRERKSLMLSKRFRKLFAEHLRLKGM